MHELSIALNILEFAEEEMERRGGKVETIHVKIGLMSGVVKKALLSAYDLAREESSLSACTLVVSEEPIVIYCRHCHAEQPVASCLDLSCPMCGGAPSEILRGKELQVVALEFAA